MKLNNALRKHLPSHLRSPQNAREEWYLAALAQENCARRIELAYPDDVLTEEDFILTVRDLLRSLNAGTFSGDQLDQYINLRLIIPRYAVRHYFPQGGGRVVLRQRLARGLCYDPEGHLQEILFGTEAKNTSAELSWAPPISHYREKGLLVENPHLPPREKGKIRTITPLFTFTQVGLVLEVFRNTHFTLNLLTLTPGAYTDLRSHVLETLKVHLEEIGAPRFCTGPGCLTPLPLNRRRYCSEPCRQRALRTRTPKSTDRVQKHYTKGLKPFLSYTPPELPSIE